MRRETETVKEIRKDVVLRPLWEYTPSEVVDIIDRVADAVRRECAVGTCGEWRGEDGSYGVDDTWELWCGPCDIPLEEEWNYCPNCGRKVER